MLTIGCNETVGGWLSNASYIFADNVFAHYSTVRSKNKALKLKNRLKILKILYKRYESDTVYEKNKLFFRDCAKAKLR